LNSEPTTLLQGTLDLLILKSLVAGEMHGLGVSRRIQQITGGTFAVKPGSLFPACTAWKKKVGFPLFGESPSTTAARNTTA
jgi:DNA-binding PadR family transcriptional regulator